MGLVYLGVDEGGTRAAVKRIKPDLVASEDFRTRFNREVKAVQRVSGPFIARFLGGSAEGPDL